LSRAPGHIPIFHGASRNGKSALDLLALILQTAARAFRNETMKLANETPAHNLLNPTRLA
jgi:hypothetical protein